MTTEKYLNWILKSTGYQNTPAEMLDLINIAQNELFSYNTYFNKKKPESSCILETIDGILQYTIEDTLVRQVAKLYVISSNTPESGYCITSRYYNGTYGNNFNNGYRDRKIEVPVQVDEALEFGDNVTLYFQSNPSTSTDQYIFDAYQWPQNGQLTSTSIPLSLPEREQTGVLYYTVVRMLEEDKDGRSIYNVEREKTLLKDFFTRMNQGAEIETNYPNAYGV